jgi:hypothetical protein
MTLTDDQLLDFDPKTATDFKLDEALQKLDDLGEVFRAQLVAARAIARWADGIESGRSLTPDHWQEGVVHGYRDIVAHLRQGDFLPGGAVYEEEQRLESGD